MEPDAILRKAYKLYIGDAYVLLGQIFGDTKKRFTDGTEVRTSKIVQEYGDNLVKTKSGTVYLVEWYRPESDGAWPIPPDLDEGL